MKKYLLSAALLVLIYANVTNAQSKWTVLPPVTDACLYGVDFLDQNNGVVVGEHGSILITSDEGVNWRKLNAGISGCLNSVCYIDLERIMAVGNDGLILSTKDGGYTWEILKTEVNAETDLLSIEMTPTGQGIIGGSSQTLLTTKDYGDTWLMISKNGKGRFNSVKILDEATAYVFGNNSRNNHVIGKITDFENLTISHEYQVFNNNNYSEGLITDGIPITNDTIITIGIMRNFPSNERMSYIAGSEVWVTDKWLPVFHSDSSFYSSIDMIDRHAIAVGGRFYQSSAGNKGYLISESHDQGKVWRDIYCPAGNTVLNDVKMLDNAAYIVGDNGLIMKVEFLMNKEVIGLLDNRAIMIPNPSNYESYKKELFIAQ